jgi:hypothetical protein
MFHKEVIIFGLSNYTISLLDNLANYNKSDNDNKAIDKRAMVSATSCAIISIFVFLLGQV